MRKKNGICIYGYWHCLILLVMLVLGPGVKWGLDELNPGFRLDIFELAFSDGKNYRVTPLNSQGPSYYLTLKASGQGILKGQWLVDQDVIGLFEVFLPANSIVHLGDSQVPHLPTNDPGLHELTLAFTNYEFSKPIPILRYFVVEGGAILIESPEPGAKVRVPRTGRNSLQLRWQWDNTGKQPPVYQVLVSDVPLHFLNDEHMTDMWKEVGPDSRYTLELPPFRRKRQKWMYWQVRAVRPPGKRLTISEISSFKLVYENK
jgi:hypothetical protein